MHSDDNVGFSYYETTVAAGTETPLHHPDDIDAVWMIEGNEELTDRDNEATYSMAPGTRYLLSGHEREAIVAHTQLRMYRDFISAVHAGGPIVAGHEVRSWIHPSYGTDDLVCSPAHVCPSPLVTVLRRESAMFERRCR